MPSAGTTTRATKRRAIIGLAIGVPLSAAFLVLALRGTDPERAWTIAKGADAGWLTLALAGLCVFMVAGGARWALLLRTIRPTTVTESTAAVVAAAALSNSIPGRPGDLARAWWAAKTSRRPFGQAASSVALDRLADVLVLTAALAVAAGISPPRRGLTAILLGATALSLILVGLVVASFVYVRSDRGRIRGGEGVERSRTRRLISTFLRGLATLTARDTIVVLVLSVISWVAFGVTAWATARSIGLDLPVIAVVMLTAVLNLGIAIPSSPGFVGTYEWLVIAALEPWVFERTTTLAYSLLLHVVTLVPPTLAGYSIIAVASRRGMRLDGTTAPAPDVSQPARSMNSN